MHAQKHDRELDFTLHRALVDKLLLELVQTTYEDYRNYISRVLELLHTYKKKVPFVLALDNVIVDMKEKN